MTAHGNIVKSILQNSKNDGRKPIIVGGTVLTNYQNFYPLDNYLAVTSVFVDAANPITSEVGVHFLNYDHINAIYDSTSQILLTGSGSSGGVAGETFIKNLLSEFLSKNYNRFDLGYLHNNVLSNVTEIVHVANDRVVLKVLMSEAHQNPPEVKPMYAAILSDSLSYITMPLRNILEFSSVMPQALIEEANNNKLPLNQINLEKAKGSIDTAKVERRMF